MEHEILSVCGNFRAVIEYDEHAGNPIDDDDGLPPVISYNVGNGLDCYGGAALSVPIISKDDFLNNWQELQGILGCNFPNILSFARWLHSETCRDYVDVLESFNDLVRQEIDGAYNSQKLELLETLYNCKAGHYAETFTVRGYCQGEWAEILVYYTPELLQSWGNDELLSRNKEALQKDAKEAAKMFECWAFGDCYTITIEEQKPACDCCKRGEFWENMESTAGHYGREETEQHARELLASYTK